MTILARKTQAPLFDLHGKAALVTGGGRGIGRGIALALARQGADVAITTVGHREAAEATAREIAGLGARALVIPGDVSRKPDDERAVAQAVESFGRLDIVVNNAGVLTVAPFLEMDEATWDRVVSVNLKGQFLVAQAAARVMVQAGRGGRIINVASIGSGGVGIGVPGLCHYTAAKGGIIGLTESMALELAPHGITVNAIAPGFIDTDMARGMMPKESVDAAVRAAAQAIPLRRPGTPDDIGAAAAYLASDEASYCTGGVVYVDGGQLAQ